LQFNDKLPPIPRSNGKEKERNAAIWRGVVINRGTKGILHPVGAAIREEEGMKVIRVLFGNKDSEYLEFGAFLNDPYNKFELITDTDHTVPFGMPELLKELEDMKGLSWSGAEPQYTASYNKKPLPYLQYQGTRGTTNTTVLVNVDEKTKVDKKAYKVQGRVVGASPRK
jgi:hypothetical protein